MEPHKLIGLVPEELFQAIFEESPRNMRRAVIGVAAGKKKKKKRSLKSKLAAKKAEQAAAVKAAQVRLSDPELNEFAEEVLRNYLAKTPEMLAAFLDFMEVPHDEGYTDDLDFVESMEPQQVAAAVKLLAEQFPLDRVVLYMTYLDCKGVIDDPTVREQLLAWGWDPDAEDEDEADEDESEDEDTTGDAPGADDTE